MTWGTVNVINNRLLYIGGADMDSTGKELFIHNEETGWHLSNMEMAVSRFRHISRIVNTSDISETYPGKELSINNVLHLAKEGYIPLVNRLL